MAHQEMVEEMAQKTTRRRKAYSLIQIRSGIMRHQGIWKNIVTKIVPLPHSDTHSSNRKLDPKFISQQ
jgi:hypothetical protein